jgi:hypothetical protein
VDYIQGIKDRYDDMTIDITPDELMTLAQQKHHSLVTDKLWQAPTPEHQEIVALTAELEVMKKQFANKQKPKPAQSNTNSKKKGKDKSAGKKGGRLSKEEMDKKFAWKLIPPKTGEPRTKTVEGKQYFFCPHHGTKGQWVIHNPEGCRAKGKKQNNSHRSTPNLEAVQAIVDFSEEIAIDDEDNEAEE